MSSRPKRSCRSIGAIELLRGADFATFSESTPSRKRQSRGSTSTPKRSRASTTVGTPAPPPSHVGKGTGEPSTHAADATVEPSPNATLGAGESVPLPTVIDASAVEKGSQPSVALKVAETRKPIKTIVAGNLPMHVRVVQPEAVPSSSAAVTETIKEFGELLPPEGPVARAEGPGGSSDTTAAHAVVVASVSDPSTRDPPSQWDSTAMGELASAVSNLTKPTETVMNAGTHAAAVASGLAAAQETDEGAGGLGTEDPGVDSMGPDPDYDCVESAETGDVDEAGFVPSEALVDPTLQLMFSQLKPIDNLEDHMEVSRRGLRPVFTCSYCKQSVSSRQEFLKHYRAAHNPDYFPWKCPMCDFKSLKKTSIAYHMNQHTDKKPFVCELCGRGFAYKQKFKLHMKYHKDIRDQQCPYCLESFHEKKTLTMHISRRHPDQASNKHVTLPATKGKEVEENAAVPILTPTTSTTASIMQPTTEATEQEAAILLAGSEQLPGQASAVGNLPGSTVAVDTVDALPGQADTIDTLPSAAGALPNTSGTVITLPTASGEQAQVVQASEVNLLSQENVAVDQAIAHFGGVPLTGTGASPVAYPSIQIIKAPVVGSGEGLLRTIISEDPPAPYSSSSSSSADPAPVTHQVTISTPGPDGSTHKKKVFVITNPALPVKESKKITASPVNVGTTKTNKRTNAYRRQMGLAPLPNMVEEKTVHPSQQSDIDDELKGFCTMAPSSSKRPNIYCKFCTSIFHSGTSFAYHLSQAHKDLKLKPYKCKECNYAAKIKGNLEQHVKFHSDTRPFVCQICGKGFIQRYKLELHTKSHVNLREWRCDKCDSAFNDKQDLSRHMKNVHFSIDEAVFCPKCEKPFKNAKTLEQHMHTHTGEKEFQCSYCNKLYSTRESLRSHEKGHKYEFGCEICSKPLGSYSAFIAHKRLHDPNQKGFPCDICGKVLPFQATLNSHKLTMHSDKRPFQCKECPKTFKTKGQLTNHQITHTNKKPYTCPTCGYSVKRKDSLKLHMFRHATVKPFRCGRCGKEYTQKQALEIHLRAKHAGVASYGCTHCSKGFNTNYLLKKHLAKAHGIEEPTQPVVTNPIVIAQEERKEDVPNNPSEKQTVLINAQVCEHCQEIFVTQHDLAVHILNDHMNQKWGVGQDGIKPVPSSEDAAGGIEDTIEIPMGEEMVIVQPEALAVSDKPTGSLAITKQVQSAASAATVASGGGSAGPSTMVVTTDILSLGQQSGSVVQSMKLTGGPSVVVQAKGGAGAGVMVGQVPPMVEQVPPVIEQVPSMIEQVPSVVEPVSSVVEQVPSVVEPVSSVVEQVPSVVEAKMANVDGKGDGN